MSGRVRPAAPRAARMVAARGRRVAGGNGVLERLPPGERDALLAGAVRVAMVPGEVLCTPGRPLSGVYFPLGGAVALFVSAPGRPPLGVGLVGCEGLVGGPFSRGANAGPLGAVVQGAGLAWRVAPGDFRRALSRGPSMQRAVEHSLRDAVGQLACTAACSPFHDIEARLAGWLALIGDRTSEPVVRSTHQQLADLLGVQRAAITVAIGSLRGRGLVACRRGVVTIIRHDGLEALACDCHARRRHRPARAH